MCSTAVQINAVDDAELLESYIHSGSREALGELIARHMDFVYNAALRQTQKPDLADDVTQGVFIVFARRARTVRSAAQLPAWLFSAVRFAAANARRAHARRRRHERASARREVAMLDDQSPDNRLSLALALLDDAIASLKDEDRDVVLLRHFRQMEISQIGDSLGISKDAVYKRLQRSLRRMREFFAARLGTETASIDTLLASAVAGFAPKGLAAATIATAASGSPPSPGAATIARGSLRALAFAKASHATLIVVTAFLVLGGSGIIARNWTTLNQTPTSVPSSVPLLSSNQISPSRRTVRPDTFSIEGIVTYPGEYQLKVNFRRLNLKQAILMAGIADADRATAFADVIYRNKPLYAVEFAVKDILQTGAPPTLVSGATVIVAKQKSPVPMLTGPDYADPANGIYYIGGKSLLRPGVYTNYLVSNGGVTLRQAIVTAGLSAKYDPETSVRLVGRAPPNAKPASHNEAIYLLKDILNNDAGQLQLLDKDVIYLLPNDATTRTAPPH
jgi:RNA polymerase sigma factor (sigma-70 family)